MTSYHLDFFNRFTTYDHPRRQLAWILLFFAALMLLASIGVADFNTKGEPREVVVAHSMLESGNWILPVDSSGDIAYKPPMFHWLVASFCWLFGSMSEFACRLPSALALVALTVMTFCFYAPRHSRDGSDCRAAIFTALLTLTAFECYRAGTNCRVDMVLTAFMCGAMMSMCKALTSKPLMFYLLAALCMSGAALTKGPVGILLPLAVYWIYALLRGHNFFAVSLIALLLLVASSLLPALYYYEAWSQGGERFYTLAMEENFGRLMGTMSYESHVNPWWYNITSLLAGWLPWSAFVLFTAVWAFYRHKKYPSEPNVRETPLGFFAKIKAMDPQRLFSLVAIVVIFVFYTIPQSKRSVYLLPMYPFMACWITVYVQWLMRRFGLRFGLVSGIMLAVCVIYPIIYGIVFPMVVNRHSDRGIALNVNRYVPEGQSVYTFIPDRFLRYYITDHYLGYRMKPLLPSGQTSGSNSVPDANDIMMPDQKVFFVAVSENVWNATRKPLGLDSYDKKSDYGLHAWLDAHSLQADSLYTSEHKTHDVRGKLVLLRVHPDNKKSEK